MFTHHKYSLYILKFKMPNTTYQLAFWILEGIIVIFLTSFFFLKIFWILFLFLFFKLLNWNLMSKNCNFIFESSRKFPKFWWN
jgi:hypothetical protein